MTLSWRVHGNRMLAEKARRVLREVEAERERQRELPPPASEEEALFRALRLAPAGLTLRECRAVLACSRSRREEAIAAVRGAEWVDELRESRLNEAGQHRMQVVLRLKAHAERYGDTGWLLSFGVTGVRP